LSGSEGEDAQYEIEIDKRAKQEEEEQKNKVLPIQLWTLP